MYHEHTVFSSSGCNAPRTWHGTNIANPEYDHECMRRAMEHANTSAHYTASRSPSATIIIIPRWEHTHHTSIPNTSTHHTHTTFTPFPTTQAPSYPMINTQAH
jgi:hypothetical protein